MPRKLRFVRRRQVIRRGEAFKLGVAVGFATLPLATVFGIPVFAFVATVLDGLQSGLTFEIQALISLLMIATAVIGLAIFHNRKRIASVGNFLLVSVGVGVGVVVVNFVIALTAAISIQSAIDLLGVIAFPPFIGVGIAVMCGVVICLLCPVRVVDADCCDHCGYDLTGNVTGKCPECGTSCLATPDA